MRYLSALVALAALAAFVFAVALLAPRGTAPAPAPAGSTVNCYINDDPSAVFYNATSLRSTPTGVRVETTDGTVYLLHTEPRELCETTP